MTLEVIEYDNNYLNNIVFLHGAGHAAWCWDVHFLPYLHQQEYNLYALSYRNHGNSDSVSNVHAITIDDYVDDLHWLISVLPAKPIIVAHSLSSKVVQLYLSKYKNNLSALVLLAPMPVKHILFELIKIRIWQTSKNQSETFYSNRLSEAETQKYLQQLQTESKKVEMATMQNFVPKNREINFPCLVMGSLNDQCVPVSVVINNGIFFKAKTVILRDLCHNMMLDPNWKKAADEICSFLKEIL